MIGRRGKFFWCVVLFVAIIPAFVRQVPEKYDYLLFIALALIAIVVGLLSLSNRPKIALSDTYPSKSNFSFLLVGMLVILVLSSLILSGKIIEIRTFYRLILYGALLIGTVFAAVIFLSYLKK